MENQEPKIEKQDQEKENFKNNCKRSLVLLDEARAMLENQGGNYNVDDVADKIRDVMDLVKEISKLYPELDK